MGDLLPQPSTTRNVNPGSRLQSRCQPRMPRVNTLGDIAQLTNFLLSQLALTSPPPNCSLPSEPSTRLATRAYLKCCPSFQVCTCTCGWPHAGPHNFFNRPVVIRARVRGKRAAVHAQSFTEAASRNREAIL
jgi:hypothetical protein